jgi:lipopolysaccharide biosynthesis glycosyltransferase
MDCDMLCQADISALFDICQTSMEESVHCVKHEYTPKTTSKMDGCRQEPYPRKNWSSLMVFNNERCRVLSPEYVNRATPADLHQFRWASDDEIGDLAYDWNWLVGEYVTHPDAAMLHYTLGGPWFDQYQNGPEARLWKEAYRAMHGGALCSTF